MATDEMVTVPEASETDTVGRPSLLGSWWAIALTAVALGLSLGWRFLADPSLSAPTRDPAWYTWRAQVILDADPNRVVQDWGPNGLFAAGYRVSVPVLGALLQRVAGIDRYTFSTLFMVGIPVFAGLALAAAFYRSRRDPAVIHMAMLAAVALFMSTPYIGYLDNATVLFLLCLTIPFLHEARTSWGARTALFLIGMAAAFTHPTTCVIFGGILLSVFGWHFLTSRFSFGSALKSDGPMLMSVGFGMIAGLSCWVIGIWGSSASLAEAALPPPYTAAFFAARLREWTLSMQPIVIVPFIVVAIASTILRARRYAKPARTEDLASIWWLLAFAGALTVITGKAIPYYRFMNASAAPMALVGLGSFAAIHWFFTDRAPSKWVGWAGVGLAVWGALGFVIPKVLTDLPTNEAVAFLPNVRLVVILAVLLLGVLVAIRGFGGDIIPKAVAGGLATVLIAGSLGLVLYDGLQRRWVSDTNQWANQDVRTSLAAVHEVVSAADADGEHPNVLLVNYLDTNDATGTNTAYGWAKTWTNVFRTGLPGDAAERSVTYLGTIDNFLKGQATTSTADSAGYTDIARQHFCEGFGGEDAYCFPDINKKPADFVPRFQQFPAAPVVFLIGQYYVQGVCNEQPDCTPEQRAALLQQATANATPIGPDVWVLNGTFSGGSENGTTLYTPSADVVAQAQAAAAAKQAELDSHPGVFANIGHNLLVVAILALILILPGWLASSWFGFRTAIDRMALIPGTSVVMLMLSGIAVLAVWRGSLTTTKGWAVALVAIGVGGALRFADAWLKRPLDNFAGFFNTLFSPFTKRAFAVLLSMQFLAQAGQGAVQGAIGKSIGFGGEKGFDVQNVPSADYLLKVILLLYIPYTLISPFIGVFIDRFARRRVMWWACWIVAAIVAAVAVVVMIPLGSETSEGKVAATAGLIIALIAAQAVARVALAVKSAALPDVSSGKDLLQGNGLSQAGGAVAQIAGVVVGLAFGAIIASWVGVIAGAGILVICAIVAMQMQNVEATVHETTFAQEAGQIVRNIVAGIKEVAGRAPAAIGLISFQMMRYQFWGFGLFVFALYAKNLVQGGIDKAGTLSLVLSGLGGLLGGAIGLVVAQKLKDRIAPIRLLLFSMFLMGSSALVFGAMVSKLGFALMLFFGFFSFFLGKISSDTITQQAMPDDFRGRAFALYDIAYNLGFIVPAFILSAIWIEGSASRTRVILVVSGAVFIGLTFLVALWSRNVRDQFAPQDDTVGGDALVAGDVGA
jgi:MFS family permease